MIFFVAIKWLGKFLILEAKYRGMCAEWACNDS